MRLGLGTGSTAAHFVRLLAERVRGGLDVVGVPTSERTARLARRRSASRWRRSTRSPLDLAVDGADEIDPRAAPHQGRRRRAVREKIVAAARGAWS